MLLLGVDGIAAVDPVCSYIVREIEQFRVGEMHGVQQGKCRPDIWTMQEGATAAIDHDLFLGALFCEQGFELIEVGLFVRGADLDGAFDQGGGADAEDQGRVVFFDACGEIGGGQELRGRPGVRGLRGFSRGACGLRGFLRGACGLRGCVCGACGFGGRVCGASRLRGRVCGACGLGGRVRCLRAHHMGGYH